MRSRTLCGTILAVLLALPAARAQEDTVLKAMRDEMARSLAQLQLRKMDKPYFLAYRVDEINDTAVSATLGSLTATQPSRRRLLGAEVRVGDYALDNSNYVALRNFTGGMSRMFSGIQQAPLDDNYREIRRQLWLATDAEYKKALEDLSGKRAALQMRKRSEEETDFSKEPPATWFEPPADSKADLPALEQLARDLSALFKQTPEIFTSSVEIDYRNFYTRYVNSEGTSFTRAQPLLKLEVKAATQADNGLPINDSFEVYGRSVSDLPAKEALVARVRAMGTRLQNLRAASSLERYNGPVLFEDAAAGEIFAQLFAPGLVATRPPMSEDPRFEMVFNQIMSQMGGGSFLEKLGGKVLPDFLGLTDNPRLEEYQGTRLAGSYKIDDDGVSSRETRLVEHGILKTLLATRVPVRSIKQSTGSRRGWGPAPSNLLLTSGKTASNQELRQELLRLAKQRGLDYGIVVRHVGGGGVSSFLRMAAMMAASPGAGPSSSLYEAYKFFADGHEEPVRGMELSGMTPANFKDIVAAGEKPVVFTDEFVPKLGSMFSLGLAASSNVPVVSCVVPSLLFEEVTLTKTAGPFPNPPLSKPPLAER